MRSIYKMMMVLLAAVLVLGGCGGGGGGSAGEPIGDTPPQTSATTLTTTLVFGDAEVASAGLRAASIPSLTVVITTADGAEYVMTHNGNGVFSRTVEDFPTERPFIVQAKAGDMILKNFFKRLPGNGATVDLGTTDPNTTLYVDLVARFLGHLDPSAEDLFDAFDSSTLEIDLEALKSQACDENDPVYQPLRKTYKELLTLNHFQAGVAPAELISAKNTSLAAVVDNPPLAGIAAEAAKVLAADFLDAYFERNWTNLSSSLATEGFLWSGMNATQWLAAEQADDWASQNHILTSERITVTAGPDPDSWWVYFRGELSYQEGGIVRRTVWDDRKQMGVSPILVKKDSTGRLAVYGDQKKCFLEARLHYIFEENSRLCLGETCEPSRRIGLEIFVGESDPFPISSAAVSGSALAQTFPMNQSDDELNLWLAYRTEDQLTDHFVGALEETTVSVTITFSDGSEEVRSFIVPPAVTPTYPEITELTPHQDGTLTMSWSDMFGAMPGGAELSYGRVEIIDDRNDWIVLVDESDLLPGTTSLTIPAGLLDPGTVYLARVSYFDVYGREYMYHRYFEKPFNSAFIWHRTFEAANFPIGWVGISPLEFNAIATIRVKDAQENFVTTGTIFLRDVDILVYDCSAGNCVVESSFDYGYAINFPVDLAAGSYTYELTSAIGQVYQQTVQYAGPVTVPAISSASMVSQRSAASPLQFSWQNPTAAAGWNLVNEIRLELSDSSVIDKVVYVKLSPAATSAQLPRQLVLDAGLNPDSSTLRWRLQSRAPNVGGRGDSNTIPVN